MAKRDEDKFMLEAVALAQRGWGKTSPNPLVGAVIVKDDRIIGRGYHQRAGEAHAEVNALRSITGNEAAGSDLYVTLEPCSTTGRTPPCTEAIIAAGIKRVFIGSLDPNPLHQGRGVKILQTAGIEVKSHIAESVCRELNEAFFTWITTGKPFVLLKMAMTLDGKIATVEGNSQWITGSDARERVQHLRQWADAIMIGGETARRDQPSLTVRSIADWQPQPRRIVISRHLAQHDVGALLSKTGGRIETVAPENGNDWQEYLTELGRQEVTAILVEGGGELAAELLRYKLVNKVEFHIAMKILGGRGSRPVIGGVNPVSLNEAIPLENCSTFALGQDMAISGYPVANLE